MSSDEAAETAGVSLGVLFLLVAAAALADVVGRVL